MERSWGRCVPAKRKWDWSFPMRGRVSGEWRFRRKTGRRSIPKRGRCCPRIHSRRARNRNLSSTTESALDYGGRAFNLYVSWSSLELLESPDANFSSFIGCTDSSRALVGGAGKRCGFESARRLRGCGFIRGGDCHHLGERIARRGGALQGFRENLAEVAHSGSGVTGFSRGAGVLHEYGLRDVERGRRPIANLQNHGRREKLETAIPRRTKGIFSGCPDLR